MLARAPPFTAVVAVAVAVAIGTFMNFESGARTLCASVAGRLEAARPAKAAIAGDGRRIREGHAAIALQHFLALWPSVKLHGG